MQFFWAGKQSYSLWTQPLGLTQCPWHLQKHIDLLPAKSTWPEQLQNHRVLWFGLRRFPCQFGNCSQFWFFQGIQDNVYLPPRKLYLQQLENLGIGVRKDWLKTWHSLIGKHQPHLISPGRILIFPGSGHRLKCWPLKQYIHLAAWLTDKGYEVLFVLGPAELERKLKVQNFKHIVCQTYEDLQSYLLSCCGAIGNDSGPLHLAGYLGVPSLTLFGPTSPVQWGPYNGQSLSLERKCSPCTQTATIKCTDPKCMRDITLAQVQKRFQEIVRR